VDYVGIANTLVYLCGHPAMVDEMRAKLIDEYDYTKEQIKFEKY
jgi:NAD(P)H-flavin reductase